MDENDRIRLRALLEARRTELDPNALVIEPLRDDATSKVDDDAKPLVVMSQVITSNRIASRKIAHAQIATALDRLANEPEEFGVCEECDQDIPIRRLELMPWARLCVRCQSDQEDTGPKRRKHLADFN